MASLYDYNFALLTPPPRSAFSLGSDADRCVLPDFADVEQLSDFVRRLFVYQFAVPHVFVQLKVGAGFTCVLLLCVALVIVRRVYERSFWLFRLQKRASGLVVVPNTTVAVILISGAFSAVLIAFLWEMCDFYDGNGHRTPSNLILWLSLPWLALSLRTLSAAWGLYFATPERLQSSLNAVTRPPRRLLGQHHAAHLINAAAVLLPIAFCAAVAAPAIVANQRYEAAFARQRIWLQRYANEGNFTEQMVRDAQQVWFDEVAAMDVAAAMFVVWFVAILVIAASYVAASSRLVLAIKKQLNKQKHPNNVGGGVGIIATSRYVVADDDDDEADDDAQREAMGRVEAMLARLTRQGQQQQEDGDSDRICEEESDGGEVRVEQGHQESTTVVQAQPKRARRWHRLTTNPALNTNTPSTTSSASPSVRLTQMQELQKAYKYLVAQSVTIVVGSLLFSVNAVLLFLFFRSSLEHPHNGGTRFEFWLPVSLLWLNWVSVLFGGGTIVTIMQRTYEPVFMVGHVAQTDEEQSPASANKALHDCEPPAQQRQQTAIALQQLESGIVWPANDVVVAQRPD